ncbi:hypothetical protein BU24DRAFT_358634 [Aaosphaeria arxii CBS 175.79]|uniref:BZIP domain-containing protein n=1 Tax=Aaosphaeria arxii CBS 175.79 TaxID=1450172 RepID=A0A6A5X8L4_9PLEO|nr:uncharacterized protein BU24DRAFT_358634 [Aaosphaeria arxii CBS 175.79]KAF2009292.1 hypothetical protein BU24DRAFT_358634 [Aaosphaeria arxii CBS 175.79]
MPGMSHLQRNSPHPGVPQMISLPPLRQMSGTPPTPSSERRPGNPLGVRSILNPEAEMLEHRKRASSQMGSPSPIETQPSTSLPSISRPTSVDSIQEDMPSSRAFPPPPPKLPHRHMLSPRSPTLHRTQSLGTLKPPTGTIDAHQSPFLGGAPLSSHPALPTPPVGARATYFPTVPAAPTPPPGGMRNGNEPRRPSLSFPQSGSASPIANYSPYSQPASVASSQHEGPSPHHSYHGGGGLGSASNGQSYEYSPSIAMETERSLIPMAPSGQSTIQMMTIKSQQGHHVQIPVDVQAASKVADEKRKRNAGASARFRARRKEKEREASQSIHRLEHQLREAAEDVDFYRTERDYFKSIVLQQPGAERHYARQPSPRLRRLSVAPSNTPSSTRGGSVDSFSGPEEYDDPRESERNVRRRTSSYHPIPGPHHSQGLQGLSGPPAPPPPPQHMAPHAPPHAPSQSHLNGSLSMQGPSSQSYSVTAASFPPINHQSHGQQSARPPSGSPYDPRDHPTSGTPRPGFRDPFASDASRHGMSPSNWASGPAHHDRS